MKTRILSAFIGLLASASALAGDHIVMITDSHGAGDWGNQMENWMRNRKETAFDFFASGGSAPIQWLKGGWVTTVGLRETSETPAPKIRATKSMKTLGLRQVWQEQGSGSAKDRRITIIAHGTNLHPKAPSGGKYRSEEVASVASLVKIAQEESDVCVWIGPPKMAERRKTHNLAEVEFRYGIIRDGIAKAARESGKPACALIDSRPHATYPASGPDGIHYNYAGAKNPGQIAACKTWADGVTKQIEKLLASGQ